MKVEEKKPRQMTRKPKHETKKRKSERDGYKPKMSYWFREKAGLCGRDLRGRKGSRKNPKKEKSQEH